MKICEKCNIKYEDDQNFCSFCGSRTQQFVEQKNCACGNVVEADANFCNFCGRNLKEQKVEAPAQPQIEENYNDIPIPPVKTGSWAKILIAMGVAFIVISAVCLII